MARFPTFPTTYEERKSFSIADLKKWGYLVQGQWKRGTINWSRNGKPNGSISISINMDHKEPYLTVDYILNKEKEVSYNISLVRVLSNLGKGHTWYFRCPYTNQLCRKLYSIDGYFMHRAAIKGYYEKQIQSKQYRQLEKTFGPVFQREKLYEQLYAKHFRKFYNSKPTKRYLKILAKLRTAASINEADLISAMVK